MSADLRADLVAALHLGPATFAMLMERLTAYAQSEVYRELTALRQAQLVERIASAGVLAHPIWRIPSDLTLPEQLADLPEYHQRLMALAMGMWPQGEVPLESSAPQQVYEERKAGRTSAEVAARIRAKCPLRHGLPATFTLERACVVALYEGHASTYGVMRRITANYLLVPGVLDILDVHAKLQQLQEEGKLGRTGEVTGARWFLKPSFFRDKPHRQLVVQKQQETEKAPDVEVVEDARAVSIENHILNLMFGGK